MKTREVEAFLLDVAQKLKTYVYRLIDPRNGETFYVGKGKGNRMFCHIGAEQDLEGDEIDNKLKRIREIRLAGFEVAHVIHRHGMDEKTAFEVEAASSTRTRDSPTSLAEPAAATTGQCTPRRSFALSAEPAVFRHKALLISVNRSAVERSLYDATRYAWKISKAKARQAEVVLATMRA